ncbi:tRNA threonylcarbamoyladenosine biosynthesis protein TsaB [Olavius algarvensis associated proteobacterium Delta 3]|nr:tRNA threonylcarbamoyladenosine biosynthesis protein TsaB [Olavius algarvensis associated proteobacterium Delta 3]
MKILAVDTSSRICGVCVSDGGHPICELCLTSGQTHSRHLVDTISRALAAADLALDEIDGFAVTRGPGSFTGLRIGISTVKGLAYASGKPLAGISSLEALAQQVVGDVAERICAVIDARKNEVYYAVYRVEQGRLVEDTVPRVGPPETIPKSNARTLFVGDGVILYEDVIRRRHRENATLAPPEWNRIRVSSVTRLAAFRLERGESDPVDTMAPFYIRKSDAELARERTMK